MNSLQFVMQIFPAEKRSAHRWKNNFLIFQTVCNMVLYIIYKEAKKTAKMRENGILMKLKQM